MNAAEHLPELNTPVFALDMTSAAGGVASRGVLATKCSHVGFLCKIGVGAGNTANDQVTLTFEMIDKSGAVVTVINSLDGDWVQTGAPLLKDTNGRLTNNVYATDAASYVTAVADGTKEIMVYIRIRSRWFKTANQIYVRARASSVNARNVSILAIREWENAGPDSTRPTAAPLGTGYGSIHASV